MAALIGALLGLGSLVNNSEMVVIRAAGVSLLRTLGAVMKAGVVLMAIAMLIGELVAPWTEHLASDLRSLALTDQITLKTRNGFWARDDNSFINIRTILPGDRVEDIYIYEFDGTDKLRVSTHARAARYEEGQWLLADIEQTTFGDDAITVRHIDRAAWESLLKPELIGMVVINPDSLAMWDLVRYIRYLRQNAQNTQRYEQALWSKMVYPLATGAMVFLAVPMVFGAARASSVGGRVLLGSLVGIAFHIVNQAAGHLGVVFEVNPAVAVFTPTFLIFTAALLLLRRVH
jgi:lipopolysaccharide export system permease protein